MQTELQQLEARLMKKKAFRDSANRVMMDVIYRVGRMTKEVWISKGLSQADLAKKLKTHQSAIARLENGNANISLGFLDKVAKALNTRLLSPRFESLKEVEDEYDERVCQNLRPVSKTTMRLEELKRKVSDASYVMPRLFPMTIGSKSNK